jgi:type VII secretion-associated serine protease mycosin
MKRKAAAAATALSAAALTLIPNPATPAAAANGSCTYPAKPIAERPWPLQRVQLDQLWQSTKGKGIRVAVIDSGVDIKNRQLKPAVDVKSGIDLLPKKKNQPEHTPTGPTADLVGHGTKVAGIIAARPHKDTGFVGLAPESTIIPIRQNDAEGSGNALTLAKAIDHAVAKKAHIINISQDTDRPLDHNSALYTSIQRALADQIVVIASAGNDGANGKVKNTYPAAYDGVLAVASSDRNNERAPFSQRGDFIDVAAPGVDIVSTVPGGGQCADNGTSFSAPYVAGVAALLRAKHPDWKHQEITAQIQQTAERSINGKDRHVGWGVIDPVRALTEADTPIDKPVASEGVRKAPEPEPAKLHLTETYAQRNERLGTYALVTGALLTSTIAGAALIHRDWRRRRRHVA